MDGLLVEIGCTFGNGPPTLLSFNKAQRADTHCYRVCYYKGFCNNAFTYNRDKTLLREALINDERQEVVLSSLLKRIIDLEHYPVLAGHFVSFQWTTR